MTLKERMSAGIWVMIESTVGAQEGLVWNVDGDMRLPRIGEMNTAIFPDL